ncbi:translation machinery-associated protein 16 [Dactylonectria macrodidyma]|uniref:Translation machinery-associated protein 16 n=1 Tax=Dactylonectria macrodidyma TaxID=307937 RepID=A0A9P9FAL8_9HYPO|nr:translation machinery-associated protein 16 [Dactylonectria macrodidyma]
MPGSLDKTRKQISKKRNGVINSLHAKSRDSLRLHKAAVRDQRILKEAATRRRKDQPLVDRVTFFQQALRVKGAQDASVAPEVEEVQHMIHSFVHQHDEEYQNIKKNRRPGRPASMREDLLKDIISTLETEYKNGFLMPDLLTTENVNALHLWEGSWSYLPQLKWVKVTSEGQVRPATFPSS